MGKRQMSKERDMNMAYWRRSWIPISVIVAGLCVSLSACAGDNDYQEGLAAALAQDLADNDVVATSPESYQCFAEGLIETLEPDTLEERGITEDSIFNEVRSAYGNGTRDRELSEIIAPCLDAEDLAITLSALGGDTAIYRCAVGALGEDRARELIVEPDDDLDQAISTCRGSEAPDPASVQAAPDTASDSGVATTTTTTAATTTTTPTPQFPDYAREIPPMVVTWNVRLAFRERLSSFGSAYDEGPRAPFAHLPSVSGTASYVVDDPQMPLSPDPSGTIVAIYEEANAIARDRLRFISLASGEDVDLVEFDSEGFGYQNFNIRWSPDGAAVVFDANATTGIFHRIGVGSYRYQRHRQVFQQAFANNEDRATVAFCGPRQSARYIIASNGASTVETLPGCESMIQATDAAGVPYVLFVDQNYTVHRIDPGEPARVLAPELEGFPSVLRICNRVVVAAAQRSPSFLFDMSSGEWTTVANISMDGCPVSNADGTRVAFQTYSESVEVVDLVTGASREVAVSGVPWAFSAAGDKLLVAGGGTFIVAADGSGGRQASVTAVAGHQGAFCRAGQLGRGLVRTEAGIGLFDIDQDQFTPLPLESIGRHCLLSGDAKWLLTDGHVVSLDRQESISLHGMDTATGELVRAGTRTTGRLVSEFIWAGQSETIVAQTRP